VTQVSRLLFGIEQFIAMLVLGVIFIRVYLFIADFVPDSGPFTGLTDFVEVVIPVVIGGYLLFVALWIIAGPVQREKSTRLEDRRRR